jgi:hypothetical protein
MEGERNGMKTQEEGRAPPRSLRAIKKRIVSIAHTGPAAGRRFAQRSPFRSRKALVGIDFASSCCNFCLWPELAVTSSIFLTSDAEEGVRHGTQPLQTNCYVSTDGNSRMFLRQFDRALLLPDGPGSDETRATRKTARYRGESLARWFSNPAFRLPN